MAKKKLAKPESIVKSLTPIEGEDHPLADLFEAEDPPVMKAIGYTSLGPGNKWVSYVLTFKGPKILSIVVSEPNLRAVAEDMSKIDFVENFMSQEAMA